MKQRPWYVQALVYALLVAGLVIFGYPFLYTLGSSMKVDRELFREGIRVSPIAPNPSTIGPFIDQTFYEGTKINRADFDRLMPAMRNLVNASGFDFPADIDQTLAKEQMAQGLFIRLAREMPQATWSKSPAEVEAAAKPIVNSDLMLSIFRETYRYIGVAGVRVRSVDLQERDISNLAAWKVISGAGSLTQTTDDAKPFAKLKYDFTSGQSVVIQGTFDLPFTADDLRRIRIEIRGDESFHTYSLDLEHQGKLYRAQRDRPLSGIGWFTHTWQFPSPDDTSTKLRFWTVLDEKATSTITGQQIRLTLTITPSSQSAAWFEKMRLNYSRVFEQIPFWRYVRVSIFLVIANIVLTVLSSSLVAYAFARIQWPGRDFCFLLMLATMMIPPQVLMIPHFVIWRNLGAFDTLTPLWLGSAFGSAFFVFMMRQFMKGIPRDLEDAGRIDGLGFLGIYWHVILPLVKPSLAAIAIFTFMGTWNNFMGPLIYITDQRLYPLAFGLYAFNVQVGGSPTLVLAGSVMMTLPVLLIFFVCQRYFVQGVTLTGVKG
jgi:ABC-type glycerol-3-phosphate transport system permease component